jgi:UDP-2,3-diacylglucosamine pyrophosphatase LpxH
MVPLTDPTPATVPSAIGSASYRTIWISDAHLGLRESKAEFLLDFLRKTKAQTYYLVGDMIDGWALKRSWYWPPSHNDVMQCLLDLARRSDITYIPGNHDEAARAFPGIRLGGIHLQQQATHTTADGRRFLILHGDEFDGVIRHARWLSMLGAVAYTGVLKLNRHVNRARRWFGMPYWSLSAYLKRRTKKAVQYIADFEEAVARRAEIGDADGVVCGHIHQPEMRDIDGVQYVNTGDWVESCTALVEHHDGRLEILRWLPDGRGTREAVVAEPLRAHADSYSRDGHAGDGHTDADTVPQAPEPVITGDGEADGLPELEE